MLLITVPMIRISLVLVSPRSHKSSTLCTRFSTLSSFLALSIIHTISVSILMNFLSDAIDQRNFEFDGDAHRLPIIGAPSTRMS